LQEDPAQALLSFDGSHHVGQVGVGDLRESGRGFGRQTELSGRRDELSLDERPRRRVRDDGGHPRLAGRTPQAEMAAEAPPLQDQPLAVNIQPLDDGVHHGPDDPLPGRDQRQAVADEQLPLSRAVDEHDVVPARDGLVAHGEVHVRHAGVIAVDGDDHPDGGGGRSRGRAGRTRSADGRPG
jgi:hypothetical protein